MMGKTDKKAYFGLEEIKDRYNCGATAAYRIIREVKDMLGGGKLPGAKVLPSELYIWEMGKNDLST